MCCVEPRFDSRMQVLDVDHGIDDGAAHQGRVRMGFWRRGRLGGRTRRNRPMDHPGGSAANACEARAEKSSSESGAHIWMVSAEEPNTMRPMEFGRSCGGRGSLRRDVLPRRVWPRFEEGYV